MTIADHWFQIMYFQNSSELFILFSYMWGLKEVYHLTRDIFNFSERFAYHFYPEDK